MRLAKIVRISAVVITLAAIVTTVTAVTSNTSEELNNRPSYVAENIISLTNSDVMEAVKVEFDKPISVVKAERKEREIRARSEQISRHIDKSRSYKMEVLATAYTPYDSGNSGTGLARDGKRAQPNYTIAVDPNFIPMHSKIYIPELDFWGEAHDTGGAINGNHIDICMESPREADKWGKKMITVLIVEP